MLRTLITIGCLLLPGFSLFAQTPEPAAWPADSFDRAEIFDQVASLVESDFFDKNFDSAAWKTRTSEFRKRAIVAASHDEFSDVVNELLSSLKTSHTHYYSQLDPKRYQLLSIFEQLFEEKHDNLFKYEGIGIDSEMIGDKRLITCVYDGLPGAKAGLRFGDQIVSVDEKPFHPILSFRGKSGKPVSIKLIRSSNEQTTPVSVELLDGRTMFQTALDSSVRILERNGKKVGYVHVWSYAGSQYQEKIREAILWGKLSECDSLIFDLRDGWGGADVNYLNLFRPAVVKISSESKSQPSRNFTGVWGKPVAMVTNRRSTSGKELFAFGFKKLKLGKVIGETTAGAVVAGRCILLPNGDALYLAVSDVRIDGQRLEGKGVDPDIVIERSIQPASENDPQIERALDWLSDPTAPKGDAAKVQKVSSLPTACPGVFANRIQGIAKTVLRWGSKIKPTEMTRRLAMQRAPTRIYFGRTMSRLRFSNRD